LFACYMLSSQSLMEFLPDASRFSDSDGTTANGDTIVHTYVTTVTKAYTVTLVVEDNEGATVMTPIGIKVTDQDPFD